MKPPANPRGTFGVSRELCSPTAPPTSADRAGTLSELLRVAVPLIISYTTSALMYVVDRIFLSNYSVEAMAASLPAGVLHYNLVALAMGTVAYANAFVGQYEGADQHQRVGPVLWQGLYLSLATAILLALLVPFSPKIFTWFGHSPNLLELEVGYFRIMCLGSLPLLVGTTLSCFYSGRGHTTVIMLVNVVATTVNIVADYVLIFGRWGFPRLGIEGAALATVIGFTVIPVLYVAIMALRERAGKYHLWTGRRLDRELFARLLKFGLPSGLHQFLDIACFTVFIQLVGALGTEQLSATSLVFNLNTLVFMPMLGLGTAITALVGRRIGEGRPELAVRTTWLASGVGLAYVSLFCLVYLLAPQQILRPYGLADKPELRALVVSLLQLAAVFSLFDCISIVFSSAIRGAGDTRFAMLFSFGLGIVLLVIPTYIAAGYGQAGFYYAWYAVTAYVMALAVGFVARFQQGKWKSMRVIEHTLPELEGEPPIEDDEPPRTAHLEGAAT